MTGSCRAPDSGRFLRKGRSYGSNCFWPLLLSSPEQSFIDYIHATRAQSILDSAQRKIGHRAAVLNIQLVSAGELKEVEKFSLLFVCVCVFILDSDRVRAAVCK